MKMEIKNKQRGCLCNHFHPPLPQLIPPGKVLLIAPIAHGDSGVVQCSAVFVWLACVITMSRKSFGSLSFLPEFHLSPPPPFPFPMCPVSLACASLFVFVRGRWPGQDQWSSPTDCHPAHLQSIPLITSGSVKTGLTLRYLPDHQ